MIEGPPEPPTPPEEAAERSFAQRLRENPAVRSAWQAWLDRVRSPRGAVATVLASIVWIAWVGAAEGAGRIPVLFLGFPVCWVGAWFLAGWLEKRWFIRNYPAVPAFARVRNPRGVRTMLKGDPNANFFADRRGFLWTRRYWFVGTGCPPRIISPDLYEVLRVASEEEPLWVVEREPRRWWWFEGRFYWENQGLGSSDVLALIRKRERDMERKLQTAHDLMSAPEAGVATVRAAIPEEVRRAVWRRDEGRCQNCGSAELLQFDHVIPLTMGGSNTAENLQLLCSTCNREKGGAL